MPEDVKVRGLYATEKNIGKAVTLRLWRLGQGTQGPAVCAIYQDIQERFVVTLVDHMTPDYRAHRSASFEELLEFVSKLGPVGEAALQGAARRDDHFALRLKLTRKVS